MGLSVRWFGVILGLVVVVAMVQRLDNLDQKSLWADELFTLSIAKYQPLLPEKGMPIYRQIDVYQISDQDTFLTAKAGEQSPPLNDLLEKAAVTYLGITEIAARLPSAVSSCALLLWFAWFAWHHPDRKVRRVIGWSLLVLALHPTLLIYAREGRAYGLGVSLVGMAGLLWMLRWRDGWRNWQEPSWMETILFLMACYSHYHAAIIVALLLSADAVMATKRRSIKAWSRLVTLGLVFMSWVALNAHTILFTTQGGVAWGARVSAWDQKLSTLTDAVTAVHPYWLILGAVLLCALALSRIPGRENLLPPVPLRRILALVALCSVYIALAALVIASAGMGHPRFFIFIIPFIAVILGIIFAQVESHGRGLVVGVAIAVLASATPTDRIKSITEKEDFRSMAIYGARGAIDSTLFLYPWVPNKNYYRLYLHRFLGEDPVQRMIGISHAKEAVQICKKIEGHKHVVVVAHNSGRAVIEAVNSTCGAKWPMRSREQFFGTFSEHWRAA